jgi:hypothetical protein
LREQPSKLIVESQQSQEGNPLTGNHLIPSNGEGGEGLKAVTGGDPQYLRETSPMQAKKSRRGETLVWLQRISQFLTPPRKKYASSVIW